MQENSNLINLCQDFVPTVVTWKLFKLSDDEYEDKENSDLDAHVQANL